ncbi:MAG: DUF2961 domain-containing protein [Armatimonadetes bacterium]|nr:DUF2961 domain-containing protein [Armatimonadota bacterium]
MAMRGLGALIAWACVLTGWCLAPWAVWAAPAARTVTMESLLREMVDMARLSRSPDIPYECDQFSSYDRASVAPDRDGWFANGDAGQFLRKEVREGREEFVMADMPGPGAIVRIWSANPDAGGTLRIYIDDMERPALEADFLALTSASLPQFPAPFSGRRALGANLYFPIPYQTRCKVTADKPGFYYHVGYRTYPPGTQVEPFSMAALPKLRPVMDQVGALLAHPSQPFTTRGATKRTATATIGPGQAALLHDLRGPAAIVRMEASVSVPEEQLFSALRECTLTVRFDDEARPCVWAPLGDFFGSAPGINPHESLPVGMRADGVCYCNWHMPFARRARIAVRNESAVPVKLTLAVWARPEKWDSSRSLYFHAKWRNEWLPEKPEFLDWPILEARGRGRFVGVMLQVSNMTPAWWGEGDEKIWVDDDTFPSFFGTGSEDYFGYAWCNTTLFSHAYHNQSICTGPGNMGYTAVARYHILDDIPFAKAIRFYIEKWDTSDREYCCTAYWYAAPGATDFFKAIPAERRRIRTLPEPYHVKGAVEGEKLTVARCTGGQTFLQDLDATRFSYGKHLWWREGSPGAVLEVKVPVERAGRYRIVLGLTKSWDYGIHQLMVNGQDVGEPVDLYSPQIEPLRMDLGVFDLPAGEVLIGFRCVGTNPEARPVNYMAGLDYVLLETAE